VTRFCKCDCGTSLDNLRADALYASDACRKRAKRTQSADKDRKRRQSRDGNGVRIYVSPDDDLIAIVRKAQAARARLRERSVA
jgi:hypothetical protein